MAYFIFEKNNIDIFKIAENTFDLNNLNGINKNNYNIVEDNQTNFDNVKYGIKYITGVQNNVVTYENCPNFPFSKELLNKYITNTKYLIKSFLNNNSNHPLFNRWNNYYSQLNNLNLDNIIYPLNKSLEQYFQDLGQPSFHPLQLP